MESFCSSGGGSSDSALNFAFAFNDVNFSDRILRIEILPDSPVCKPDPDDTLSCWARTRKRRRNDNLNTDVTMQREEQILNCTMPDMEDGYVNQGEEIVAMIEETPSVLEMTTNQVDDEVTQPNETSSSMDCSPVQVKTIHISSPILAAKSPFFYKLFSNGMNKSVQRHVTIQIHASEEAALMDLLNFMYSNSLPRTTPPDLLDVLMAADKFEVASCMRYCSRLLRNLPMTCESALLYLDLPSTISMGDTVQPLTDAAKKFLATRFKDLSKFQEEVLNLPLAGITAVLSSDNLQVASEDAVYDFVLKWARTHYSKLEERREILSTHLLRFIRFPCMSCRKLKKVLGCNDFDTEIASKVVLDALFFKAEAPYRQRSLMAEEANTSSRRFVERAYKYRPVKVIEFESPRLQCIVYLDLTQGECAQLFPAGRVYSQAFHLGGQGFFLSAHCNMDQQSSFHCFGLFLGMQEKGSVAFAVDYEFASRTKPSEEFVSKYKGNYTFTGGKAVGYRNLFSVPWSAFMDNDSPYFINGILHLRAELTIKQ
ncbi:BTB POZ domain-containing POB1-like isoform X1 [Olea europaea subsp. europaea]|uniref:BTB POZ domain-containing POB1-like isoform X1 n=4 Tax=Olea europaea subsp. europaea TaxID=158383 RepID=A0A8S0VEN9_OLEEU|nr:BTB POZ domain-containing POB1-like isoform X1 [Olea europaea subsp. europaea]